jgi:hypothetical protein
VAEAELGRGAGEGVGESLLGCVSGVLPGRLLAAKAWAYAVAVERRYRGLPPLPDIPVPYTLTAQAEALLEAGPVGADLVPLPGGREVTA